MNMIKILLIEDNPGDARLLCEMLNETGDNRFDIKTAGRLISGLDYLKHNFVDTVILDLGLPDSQGLDSFRRIYKQSPKVPVLVMTGLTNESIGIQAVQEGAQDYLLKGTVDGKLLSRIIRFAIERKQILDERNMLIEDLREAMSKIKTLKGLVPICSYCKKIRNDKGFWEQLETYVSEHTGAEFSHGMCQECEKQAYEEYAEFMKYNRKQGEHEE